MGLVQRPSNLSTSSADRQTGWQTSTRLGLGIVSSLLLAACSGGGGTSDDKGGDDKTNTAPTAAFTMQVDGNDPTMVHFDATGSTDDKGVVTYSWNFGDNSTGTGVTVTHDYPRAGSFPVTLTVKDIEGLSDEEAQSVTVSEPDGGDDGGGDDGGGDDGGGDDGGGDDGGGDDGGGDDGGGDDGGGDDGKSDVPTARLTTDTTNGDAPMTVTFDASGSSDDEGIVSYDFDVDSDGTFEQTGATSTFSYEYTTADVYDALVRVTDADNQSDTAIVRITVNEPPNVDLPPTASLTVDVESGTAPLTVSLDASGSTDDQGILSYNWDLNNDGNYEENTTTAVLNTTFDQVGTYVVKVQAIDTKGQLSNPASVTINATGTPPTASFSASTNGLTVKVDASASVDNDENGNGIITYQWTWGDGQSENTFSPNTSHTYANEGSPTISLVVVDDEDTPSSAVEDTVTVTRPSTNQPPEAAFSASINGYALTLSNSSSDPNGDSLTYSWDFGDGNSSSDRNPSHTYADHGNYTISLSVTDPDGLEDSNTKTVLANMAPEVSVSANPGSGNDGDTISLTANATDDDSIATYDWDFGDGSQTEDGGASLDHQFNLTNGVKSKDFIVTVTATDSDGETTEAQTTVSIVAPNIPPVADITNPSDGASFEAGTSIAFSGTASDDDGTISSRTWDFGDGQTANGTNASHSYDTAGDYTVQFTATDSDGAEHFDEISITITEVPNVAPTAIITTPNDGASFTVGEEISFGGSGSDSDGDVTDYSWDFGGGNTSNSQNPKHTYNSAGSKTITLVVTDNDSDDSAPVSIDITIYDVANDAPTASIDQPSGNLTITAGDTVDFQGSGSDSDGSISSYAWDFKDGGTSTQQDPSHTFNTEGTYEVSLIVTDNDGEPSAAVTVTITVEAASTNEPLVPGTATVSAVDVDAGSVIISFGSAQGDAPSIKSVSVTGESGLSYADPSNDTPEAGPSVEIFFPTLGSYSANITLQDAGDSDQTETVNLNLTSGDAISINGTVIDNDGASDTPVTTDVILYWEREGVTKSEVTRTDSDGAGTGSYEFTDLIGPIEYFQVLVKGGNK